MRFKVYQSYDGGDPTLIAQFIRISPSTIVEVQ